MLEVNEKGNGRAVSVDTVAGDHTRLLSSNLASTNEPILSSVDTAIAFNFVILKTDYQII